MKILDTNIVLRFMLRDNIEMTEKAIDLINNYEVLLTNEVVAEVVYVLNKVYNIDRKSVSNSIQTVLRIKNIKPTDPIVLKSALIIFGENSLDFVECILIAYHRHYGYEVCTFDKKLIKNLDRE